MPVHIIWLLVVLAMFAVFAALMLKWWLGEMRIAPGRKVTVSLTDGTVLSGRTRPEWPGRIRLAEVETSDGDVPGFVVVNVRHVLVVQVVS